MDNKRTTQNFGRSKDRQPFLKTPEPIPPIWLEPGCGWYFAHALNHDEYRFWIEMGLWEAEYHANWNI